MLPRVNHVFTGQRHTQKAANPMNDLLASPQTLGRLDAEDGELCIPEAYFPDRKRQREYALGYHAVRPSALSAQILGYVTFVPATEPEAVTA